MQNNEQPSAMKIRQNIQEFMTYTITDKEFNEDDVELINVDIELDNLDWVFHNYKIINLTDIHIGQWIQPEYLDNLVEYINTLNSDMIVLTGDYVSYILDGYENDLEKSLKKLKAKDAKLAVLGNHDHWMGAEKIRKILKNADIIDLSNDVYILEKGDSSINIAGVDSCTVGKDDLNKIIAKIPDDNPCILLVHEPDFAEKSSKTNKFDLQISGHSHGGQLIIPMIETTPFRGANSQKYPVGKYKVGNMIQYTSRGLGTNSFRLRINCKPEITIFTLKTTKKKKINVEDEIND